MPKLLGFGAQAGSSVGVGGRGAKGGVGCDSDIVELLADESAEVFPEEDRPGAFPED